MVKAVNSLKKKKKKFSKLGAFGAHFYQTKMSITSRNQYVKLILLLLHEVFRFSWWTLMEKTSFFPQNQFLHKQKTEQLVENNKRQKQNTVKVAINNWSEFLPMTERV